MKTAAVVALPLKPRSPRALYEEVKNFRNDGAVEYYARTFGLDRKMVEEHFNEMLKFLCLARFHADQVTPSDQLDEMWHAMIIQTNAYRELGERLGGFVHHSTTGNPRREAYRNAIALYRAEFGEPHPIWISPKLKHADLPSPAISHKGDRKECEVSGWCSACGSA